VIDDIITVHITCEFFAYLDGNDYDNWPRWKDSGKVYVKFYKKQLAAKNSSRWPPRRSCLWAEILEIQNNSQILMTAVPFVPLWSSAISIGNFNFLQIASSSVGSSRLLQRA
jgi:hypothetical protein